MHRIDIPITLAKLDVFNFSHFRYSSEHVLYLPVVFILISIMANNAKHLSILVGHFVQCLFRSSVFYLLLGHLNTVVL